MFHGVGNDIIEVDRIAKAIEKYGRKFLERLFTRQEIEYCMKHRDSERHFAGRFAAKEALAKALGTGISGSLSWLDIEICNDESGKPIVKLSEKARKQHKNPQLHISISHCKKFASAVALCFLDQ